MDRFRIQQQYTGTADERMLIYYDALFDLFEKNYVQTVTAKMPLFLTRALRDITQTVKSRYDVSMHVPVRAPCPPRPELHRVRFGDGLGCDTPMYSS